MYQEPIYCGYRYTTTYVDRCLSNLESLQSHCATVVLTYCTMEGSDSTTFDTVTVPFQDSMR